MTTKVSKSSFWGYFWLTILILLAVYFTSVYKASQLTVIENGTRILLSDKMAQLWEQHLPTINQNIDLEFNNKAKAEIEFLIDTKIDEVFTPVYRQIPIFADFHYSVTGEYTEIISALSGKISNRAQKILFEDTHFEATLRDGIDKIHTLSNARVFQGINTVNADVQNKIGLNYYEMSLLTKTLDLSVNDAKKRFNTLSYSSLRGAGLGIGFAATSSLFAKVLGKKLATKIAAKTAVKVATKGATAAGGFVTGTAVCAGLGFLAPVCGIGAAAGIWLATDKLIVEIDEHFNRAEFELQLTTMVNEQKQQIKQGLKQSYEKALFVIAEQQITKIKQGVSTTPQQLIYPNENPLNLENIKQDIKKNLIEFIEKLDDR